VKHQFAPFAPFATFTPNQERIPNIPLPDLQNVDWGQPGDDQLRGLALLRALRDGQ
jgi:hypothetical protein